MSRAVYNDLCDIYRGPAPLVGVPNARYRANVPCRLILYDKIFPRSEPFDYEFAWLTHPLPVVARGGPDFLGVNLVGFNFDQYDRIVVLSDLTLTYLAWNCEEVLPGTPRRYARCRLITMPYPW